MDGTTGFLSTCFQLGSVPKCQPRRFFDTRNKRTPGRDEQAVRRWNTICALVGTILNNQMPSSDNRMAFK